MVSPENDSMAEVTLPVRKEIDDDTLGVPEERLTAANTTKPGKKSYRDIPHEEAAPEEIMLPRPSELSVESIAKLEGDRAVDVFLNALERDNL